jgi:hypothetical protein
LSRLAKQVKQGVEVRWVEVERLGARGEVSTWHVATCQHAILTWHPQVKSSHAQVKLMSSPEWKYFELAWKYFGEDEWSNLSSSMPRCLAKVTASTPCGACWVELKRTLAMLAWQAVRIEMNSRCNSTLHALQVKWNTLRELANRKVFNATARTQWTSCIQPKAYRFMICLCWIRKGLQALQSALSASL